MNERKIFSNFGGGAGAENEGPAIEAEVEEELKETPAIREGGGAEERKEGRSETEKAFSALEEQERQLLKEEGRAGKKSFNRARNALATGMVLASSFLQVGCEGKSSPKPETERERIERIEAIDGNKDKQESNKNLLREVFFNISNQGSSMGKSRRG